MIIQLLGVALISLLTITPTIQQNNIEQLIAPNIEIQDNSYTLTSSQSLKFYINRQFTFYTFSGSRITDYISYFGTDVPTVEYTEITIIDDNFHIYLNQSQVNVTGSQLRTIIRNYYEYSRGSLPSGAESFSFTVNTSNLTISNTSYTYSVTGTQGTMSGTVFTRTTAAIDNNSGTFTNNVSIQTSNNLNNLIQAINPIPSFETTGDTVILYMLDQNIPTASGTYTRTLYGKTAYQRNINFGQVTFTILPSDTTPPTITSITGNPVNWTNQNVVLTVQATDDVALNNTAFSFDNGINWFNSNISTQFSTNQIVNIKVRDSSNNETSQQVTINRIDKQSPSINLAGNWRNTFELGELTSNNDLYNYLSISDGASGINSSLTTINNFNYNQAGTYTNVQVSATDNAGNTFVYTTPTITITQPVDNTPPTISGSTSITRQQGNITTQDILSNFTISDPSGIAETRIQRLDNTIVTSWNDFTTGTYQLRVYARDTVGNIALYQFELIVTAPPVPDTTSPVITGSLLTSFVIGTYTSTSEILALYTITDNVAVGVSQVIGTIDFEQLGDYPVTISATDTSNNTTTLNIVVRIRADVVLGNYNPLTDLLSGIFGGLLSMIFTIGTINILGLRLLDAMGVIILGAVLLFVYKAIKGGS
jgi:hypothetical protein